MGAFLDKPITDKETHAGAGNNLIYGLSAMQGWRVEMEDAHAAEVNIPNNEGLSFFAVFDGHGGSTVSTAGASHILSQILDTDVFKAGDKTSPETLSEALHQGLFDLDRKLRQFPKLRDGIDHSGSTCVSAFISPSHIVIGNCGDSRAVVATAGGVRFASQDHKPTNPLETARVQEAGGFVEMGRVCGNLAVSRALGDYQYKDSPQLPDARQKISADADMTILARQEDDQFLILACDGIWDVLSNEQAVDFVANHLRAGKPAEKIAEDMLDFCLAKNSRDNMSVVLVLFPGAPKPSPEFHVPPELQVQAAAGYADSGAASFAPPVALPYNLDVSVPEDTPPLPTEDDPK